MSDGYEGLRAATQADLGAFLEVALGANLWSIQKDVCTYTSLPRSRVDVPSCNSSGKSFVAGGIAVAFYWAFEPGKPCILCKGPCGGGKVITTSSSEAQLVDVLWSEIRGHFGRSRVPIPGSMPPRDPSLRSAPNHFLIGHSPAKSESFQGYHAPHVLIIGDEATSIPDGLAYAINSLLASGDARLLLVYNPTTEDTFAYEAHVSPRYKSIRIPAWKTPHFTGEPIPPGASLITPDFLEEMKARGQGPGTFEWETRIEAKFWAKGSNVLIPGDWYQQALESEPLPGPTVFGVDLASYGDSESVCAIRKGNALVHLETRSSIRADIFWKNVVGPLVVEHDPQLVVFDADGVGAGSWGDAEAVCGNRVRGFRGAIAVGGTHRNIRSLWWWMLRQRFEMGDIHLGISDSILRRQMTNMQYVVNDSGQIQVESKTSMKRRNVTSPDRADAVMYAFSTEAPTVRTPRTTHRELVNRSADTNAMWERFERNIKRRSLPSARPNPFRS